VTDLRAYRDAVGVKWVNGYQLLQDVGQGTFCTVKLATTQNGSTHAIKRFARAALRSRMVAKYDAAGVTTVPFEECLEGEIRILEQLAHPHIVQLQEVIDCAASDSLYVIYEGLPGGQLMEWREGSQAYSSSTTAAVAQFWGDALGTEAVDLAADSREVVVLQEELARHFCLQLADGIAYMHDRGVIHKDLKPENLVLSKPIPRDARFVSRLSLRNWPDLTGAVGTVSSVGKQTLQELLVKAGLDVKIADFNSAVACEEPDCLIYDAQGTQQFTPPECFINTDAGVLGKPRDMWSLGCVLFVMAFGHCPFWADTNIELQMQVITAELSLPDGGPGSTEFRRLITALLGRGPATRPNARALLLSPWLTSPRAMLGG